MVDIKKFSEIDLYKLIGVEITANENEVSLNIIFHSNNLTIFNFINFRFENPIVKKR